MVYLMPQLCTLQRVQNSLARIVCNPPKRSAHSSTLLKTLHWLPIAERIKYKIAQLTLNRKIAQET
jgi:hypothetical protein